MYEEEKVSTWEKTDSFTYPVFDKWPSGVLWGIMVLDIGDSLIDSRGRLTFKYMKHIFTLDHFEIEQKFMTVNKSQISVDTRHKNLSYDVGKWNCISWWANKNVMHIGWISTSLKLESVPWSFPWKHIIKPIILQNCINTREIYMSEPCPGSLKFLCLSKDSTVWCIKSSILIMLFSN